MRILIVAAVVLLTACAPNHPSNADARAAVIERMESSTAGKVDVTEIHALDLSACEPARGEEGVVCQVAMDVVFSFDGEMQRSNEAGPVRFVREGGAWKAYLGKPGA